MPLQILPKLSLKLKNRIVTYFFIAWVTSLLFAVLYFGNAYFSVKKIEITGESDLNIIGIDNLKGKNLLLLSQSNAEKEILMQNPIIKKISISKLYPSTINITLESTTPLAVLQLNTGLSYLDRNGKIIAKTKENTNQFPYINFYQKFDYSQLQSGDTLDYEEILTSLYLLETVSNLGYQIKSINIKGMSMIVFNLTGDVQIIFTSEKTKEKQAFEAEAIIKQFTIEAREFKILDLRFDKPIIKF